MNGKRVKEINKKALELSLEWMKSMLPDSEVAKVTCKDVPLVSPLVYKSVGTYASDNPKMVAYNMAYSYKGLKSIIKDIIKRSSNKRLVKSITKADIDNYLNQINTARR
jgi:hypothetical protein